MKKSILVIDDSPFIIKQIKDILKDKNYEVIGHAKNGEEGVEAFKKRRPDVVILDIVMPGIDGLETATNLLTINSNAKIIMMSSLCGLDTFEEVKEIGIPYLLPKPIEEKLLLETLDQINKK